MVEFTDKVGAGSTTTVNVFVEAQLLPDGVKVYVVVLVLSRAGDQDPVIPFVEVVGKLKVLP